MGRKKQEGSDIKRSSLWAFIFYPGDSAPDNWLEILRDQHIPLFVSPLHRPDPEGGEARKPHRHVMLFFGTLKSFSQAKDISDLLGAARPFRVESEKGYGRYLIHLDDPDKQQWSDDELKKDPVLGLAGMSYSDKLLDWEANNDDLIKQIELFIDENDYFSLYRLKRWCRDNNEVWYRLLNKRTIAIDLYMKSRLWTLTKESEALFQYQRAKEAAAESASAIDDDLIEQS